MAHSTPKDPMATPVLIGGLVLIGAAVAVLVSNLFSTIEKNSIKGEIDTTSQVVAMDANLAPIGKVNAVDKSIVKEARSGEAVYTAVCAACHTSGVLNAPKIDDKGAWDARVANGLDGLMKNATNGLNSMPARGGDPSITDEELSNAIVYMTGKAGHDLSSQAKPAAAAPAAAAPAQAAAPAAAAPAATAPAQAAAPAATAPAQAAAPAATAPAQAAAPAAAASAQAAAPAAAASAQAAAPAAAINGEKVYKGICFSCHDVGVAGSPKLGDKAVWAPRIATGAEALYATSLNGKGAMPAKGGNPALSDDEIKAAVDYMVAQSQ
ncbi:c-type cytochrome [Thiothrix winogradskyi]|uniref:C-type cytochrome n=1 Tax=Thiothrix winogradskyi TaxID=96472 RepID=A0ABY3T0S4_9GAMM|nr:c-type cytochrome [Thiothrix winogradskyi]UJS24822.1 c-type cytochrome [Thiothrix winogradskyi]